MLEMAIRRRWDVNTDRAAETINALLDSPDERIALRAASIAREMEGQNQKDEHEYLKRFTEHRIAELDQVAVELGLDESVVKGIACESQSDS